jgi:hypothetical protein
MSNLFIKAHMRKLAFESKGDLDNVHFLCLSGMKVTLPLGNGPIF